MLVHRTTVDGVPVCWTPGANRLSAGLAFRVGRADETLVTAGLSHLLEHLVLFPVERADLHVNGVTSMSTTTFRLDDAEPDELVSFVDSVCAGLREPPVERLDAEKAILRTEAGIRDFGLFDRLRAWRYGPAGFGLCAFDEYGLDRLTAGDVQDWAATRFTKQNAVLWIDGGPPPDGLRLDLPDGRRMPFPEVTSVPRLPGYFVAPAEGAAFELVVPRSRTAELYAEILNRRLYTRLRRELGISYAAAAGYQPRDDGNAVVTVLANALPEHRALMCRTIVDLLVDLSREEPTEEEQATARTLVDRRESAEAAAEQTLAGAGPHAETDLVTVGKQALSTAFALLPEGCAIGRAGFVRAPGSSPEAIDGESYPLRNRPDETVRLVVGTDGVSLVNGLQIATVRFADCRGMLAWPDGARQLFGADAVSVRVEPTVWDAPDDVWPRIDAAVPEALRVPQDARAPERIPAPPPAPPVTGPPEPRRRYRFTRNRQVVVGIHLVVFCVAMLASVPLMLIVVVFALTLTMILPAVDR